MSETETSLHQQRKYLDNAYDYRKSNYDGIIQK